MSHQIVYGRNPVFACLKAGKRKAYALHLLRDGKNLDALRRAAEGVPVRECQRGELDKLARGGVHQGVILETDDLPVASFDDWVKRGLPENALLVVLDGVEDPHNFGAITRTACACGANAVIFAEDRAAPLSPVAVKSSAGAVEYIDLVRAKNLNRAMDALKDLGVYTTALDSNGGSPIWDATYTGPSAIVIGSEGKGIRRSIVSKCDARVLIPTPGPIPSLNASVAAAVALAEVLRQRSKG